MDKTPATARNNLISACLKRDAQVRLGSSFEDVDATDAEIDDLCGELLRCNIVANFDKAIAEIDDPTQKKLLELMKAMVEDGPPGMPSL